MKIEIKNHCERVFSQLETEMVECEHDAYHDLNKYIYYLESGEILCYCDDNIIFSIVAPRFIGLSNLFNIKSKQDITLKLLNGSRALKIGNRSAQRILSEHNLYDSIGYLLSFESSRLIDLSITLKKQSAYELTKAALLYYLRDESSLCNNVSIATFVADTTGISKSRTAYILQELKKGKYIEIKDGKLIKINRLPPSF